MNQRKQSCFPTSPVSRSSSFSRQPPRVLIVDTSPPWWSETRSVICEALDNFLALASSLEGPSRLPLLSLYAVSLQQECLLPFVQVKGNFVRLQSCVEELRSLPKEGCTGPRGDLLKQAVLDGLQQFKQFVRHAAATSNVNSHSVEVTLLTGRPGRAVVRQLEERLKDSDLVSLRRLLVVHIAVEQNYPERESAWSQEGLSTGGTDDPEENLMLHTVVDLQVVENCVTAVENVLKMWLHDQGGDREHLHLLLPPSLQDFGPDPNPGRRPIPVCLKCDMQERLLSPALLSGIPVLGTKTESLWDFHPSVTSLTNQSPSPQRLRVIKALRAEGVCQSVLYGLPLVIRSTTCWQLDWDELETNHQTFHALCYTLRARDWFLLVRSEPDSGCSTGVFSYYLLQSSSSLSLLLKPVLTRELLLSSSTPVSNEDPPASALTKVQSSLDQLEEDPMFNPLCLSTNLYRHLKMRGLAQRRGHPYGQNNRTQNQSRPQRRDSLQPPEGSTSRQSQGRVRATVAPLPSAAATRLSRRPLTLSRSRPHGPSPVLDDTDDCHSDVQFSPV
ncbi:meiosis 1 arrest protein [Chanos chanos]|uniref:Meiosis 1 arrest protein n=1 Tax=Chanos chanos TaxID=29144 RepID=A0A6J2VV81_CHACN|nr:meiosis 1 arrest protein [Chanos chanos]